MYDYPEENGRRNYISGRHNRPSCANLLVALDLQRGTCGASDVQVVPLLVLLCI